MTSEVTSCDHQWLYEPPDYSVGIQGGLVCANCEEDREPTDEEWQAIYRGEFEVV